MKYQIVFINKGDTPFRHNQEITIQSLLTLMANPVAFVNHQLKGLSSGVSLIEIKQCDDMDNNTWSMVLEMNIEHGLQAKYDELKLKASRDADLYDQNISRLEAEVIELENNTDLRTLLLQSLNRLSRITPNQELATMLRTHIKVSNGIAENTSVQCGHILYGGMCTSPLGIINGLFPDGNGIAMKLDSPDDMFISISVPVLQSPEDKSVQELSDVVEASIALPSPPTVKEHNDCNQKLTIQLTEKASNIGSLINWRNNGWSDMQLVSEGYATHLGNQHMRCKSHGCVTNRDNPSYYCTYHKDKKVLINIPKPPSIKAIHDDGQKLTIGLTSKGFNIANLEDWRNNGWTDVQLVDTGYAYHIPPPSSVISYPFGHCAITECHGARLKNREFCILHNNN